MPTHSILQVINSSESSTVQANSSTFVDTGLTATITPISSSSKILVIVNQNGFQKSAHDTSAKHILLRGSTEISIIATPLGYNASTNTRVLASSSIHFLDTPNTTNEVKYIIQFCEAYSTQSAAYINYGPAHAQNYAYNSCSSITLEEIAG